MTFSTPAFIEGYIREQEIYDPLVNGKTVGDVVGQVEWVIGEGVRLVNHDSRITYHLPQTLEVGEFSIMVTGMDEGSQGDKTKVMSMQEGDGSITDNDYRVTIEKRGRDYPTPGAVTFRIITGDATSEEQIHDGRRVAVGFSDELWYFWKFDWDTNGADLEVFEGGENGAEHLRRRRGRLLAPVPAHAARAASRRARGPCRPAGRDRPGHDRQERLGVGTPAPGVPAVRREVGHSSWQLAAGSWQRAGVGSGWQLAGGGWQWAETTGSGGLGSRSPGPFAFAPCTPASALRIFALRILIAS